MVLVGSHPCASRGSGEKKAFNANTMLAGMKYVAEDASFCLVPSRSISSLCCSAALWR